MRYPVAAWSRLSIRPNARGLVAALGAIMLLAGCQAGKDGATILPANLGPNGTALYYQYLEAEEKKAFAYASDQWSHYVYGRRYREIAIYDAIEQCELNAGERCELLAVGNTLFSDMSAEERAKIIETAMPQR